MKRLLLAAVLAMGALAATQSQARANGGSFGFGIGIGISFSANCSGPGCYPPGPPMGGMMPPPYFMVPIPPQVYYMPGMFPPCCY
jgi:hypothetical protein